MVTVSVLGESQNHSRSIAERNSKRLAAFRIYVVDNGNQNALRALPGGKAQRTNRSDVVAASRSSAINDVAIVRAGCVAGCIADAGCPDVSPVRVTVIDNDALLSVKDIAAALN